MTSIPILLCSLLALSSAQNLGNPGFLGSYPACSAQCLIEVTNSGNNPCAFTTANNLTCSCDVGNRAATSACEKVSCSPAEYDTTMVLAEQLCGPLYNNGTLQASPVSAAIASATAVAAAAVAGKDVTNPNSYPPCATACQLQNVPSSACGSLSNANCVCNDAALNRALAGCERSTCSAADFETVRYLSYVLCRSAGGIGNASEVANQTVATQTAVPVPIPAPNNGTVAPFTGGAGLISVEARSWMSLAAAFGVMYVMI